MGKGRNQRWMAKCNFTCCLEAICEGNHLSLLDLLPGAAAGDDTEDASTEFTDSIEEEAAHNSHLQVSQCVRSWGSPGGRHTALLGSDDLPQPLCS